MNTNASSKEKSDGNGTKRAKRFHGIDNAPPPMNGVPLPCVEGAGVQLNIVPLVDQL
jgi:hypothetical protein